VGTRVLLVSWDGAERDLVERWTRDGRLPALARLRADGEWREVVSPEGLGDSAAWTSFATGVDVAVHGRTYWQALAPNGHDLYYRPRSDTPVPAFWDELARGGARVAAIDVPALAGSGADAFVVTNWTTHAAEHPAPYASEPGLVAGITRDPGWDCDDIPRDTAATRAFERSLVERARLREEVVLPLLADEQWDVFVTVHSEHHCIGHQCWHDHDESHSDHDAARRAECGDPMETVYRDADAQLARLVEAAGPDVVVVVCSLLGMRSNHSGEHLLDEILVRLDGTNDRPTLRLRAVRAVRRAIPERVRRRAPERVREVHRDTVTRERERRSAWVLPTNLQTSAVRIGVVGRDDGGVVEPGAPRDERCAQLTEALLALEDPATGRRLVDHVVDVRTVHGPNVADEFADLLVVWSQAGPITAARSDAIGVVRGTPPHRRTGNHRTDGWAVVSGAVPDGTLGGVVLQASYFAHLLGALVHETDSRAQPA
jgi:predicted AlkP superfamily phosphohydrolase/phosphomutase